MKQIFTKILLLFFLIGSLSLENYAQSVGGTISGATSICPNSTNSGFLMLNGYTGNSIHWESSTNGGTTWTNIGNPISSYSYSNITQTTCYRAVVQSGAFPPDTSTTACITIIPPSVGGTITGGGVFCATAPGDTLFLTGKVGNVLSWEYSTNGGTSWTTVSNTTVTLVYAAITQNTLYRAIVQEGAGCPKDTSSKAIFKIDPLSVAGTISGSDTVCHDGNAGTLNLSGKVGAIVDWIGSVNGINWTSFSNTTASQVYNALPQTVLFGAVVKSGSCNADTAFATITVRPPVPVSAGNDTSIVSGQSGMLNGSGNGTALWSPSAGLSSDTLFHPAASPGSTTQYILTVTDSNGCMNKDTMRLTVTIGEFEGVVSTLFTPDDDGVNDTWYIKDIQNFPDNEVSVFNIYGNKVFGKKGYTNDWKGTYNGSALPTGTYYYVLKFDDSSEAFKGSVDILRK